MATPRSAPQFAKSNGLEICYDTFGSRSDAPLLLVMGLGGQLIAWDDAFCAGLAQRGHFVVRFDNRDIGLSTKFAAAGVPNILELLGHAMQGKPVTAPYLLRDMAADAIGLLDALGIDKAHVVGLSMGGAIAQEMAINFAGRLRTLTSIMATTGDPTLPQPKPEALSVFMTPAPNTKEAYAAFYARNLQILRGKGFPEDEALDPARGAAVFERGLNPPGLARQLAAIIASGDRTPRLRSVTVPTLVLHGDADPLVPVQCGVATAAAIPGAKLMRIPGMGHALPISLWPTIIDAIAGHAR